MCTLATCVYTGNVCTLAMCNIVLMMEYSGYGKEGVRVSNMAQCEVKRCWLVLSIGILESLCTSSLVVPRILM